MSTDVPTHVSIGMCTLVYTHVYTHVYYTHVCTYVYTHVHTHVYTHVYTHVHTHVYTHVYALAIGSVAHMRGTRPTLPSSTDSRRRTV